MIFRKAIDEDIPCFIEFRKILLRHEDDNSMDNILTNFFNCSLTDKSLVAWVAEDYDKIVSTVCLSICQLVPRFDNPSGKIAYISNVYTIPNYRCQGIASKLIMAGIHDVETQGVRKILLHSSDMAKSIYLKLGFTEGKNYLEFKM